MIVDNKKRVYNRHINLQTIPSRFRLSLIYFAAASLGLPVAIIGIAKLMLLVGGALVLLFVEEGAPPSDREGKAAPFHPAILAVVALFALSITWSTAPLHDALSSLGKYGKLLMISMIVMLVRSRVEALHALIALATTQIVLLFSSWMLFFQIPVPWATSAPIARMHYAVFSSYLDQGVMTAVFAALCWHMRAFLPGKLLRGIALLVVLLALINVLFVLKGRTGHAVAIALLSLAILWETPRKYRVWAFLVPVFLVITLALFSPKARHGVMQVKADISGFSLSKGVSVDSGNSSAIRLHFWNRALQSISENPVAGAGVGSWTSEFNRLERLQNSNPEAIAPLGNPHQEYLLWGVQLGIPGVLLLIALMLSVLQVSRSMDQITARATVSVLLSLAIACLFNSVIYDALIGDFFCVTLGLLLALGSHSPSKIASAKDGSDQPCIA